MNSSVAEYLEVDLISPSVGHQQLPLPTPLGPQTPPRMICLMAQCTVLHQILSFH